MNNSDSRQTLMEYLWGDVKSYPEVEKMLKVMVELVGFKYNPSYLTSHETYVSYVIPAIDESSLIVDDLIIVFINGFVDHISINMYIRSHEHGEKIQYPINRIRAIYEVIASELTYIKASYQYRDSYQLGTDKHVDIVCKDIVEVLKDKKEIIDLLDI